LGRRGQADARDSETVGIDIGIRAVIIGAGAAGISAAATLREHSPKTETTVISKEKRAPYSPVALPDYIEGRIPVDVLSLWNEHSMDTEHTNLVLGKSVAEIRTNAKGVVLDDGSVVSFDRLLIASGASPILTGEMQNRRGVFTLRTLEDAEQIRKQIKERVIVYGAGAVAVKISTALHQMGVDVIMICRSRVLSRLFDEDICRLIHDTLIGGGIKVVGAHPHMRILGDPVDRFRLGHREFRCDGVIAALGVAPNTSFLTDKTIRLGRSGGICVNERMETSARDIYAAGDCAETKDIISGTTRLAPLWPLAVEQGRIAALNMCGETAAYEGALPYNVINVFDVPFVSIGSLEGERVEIARHGSITRLTVRNGLIVGAQIVGDVKYAALISSSMRKGLKLTEVNQAGLGPRVPFRPSIGDGRMK